ncbi:hypothetical protein ACH5RR_032389 [Cinchona calisaya]|uniref:RNase H type-1 domain-containing protein n=1 Tax=Cinchona calisaya TaxID=153742 RepID=A0ABD2YL25_9GENT
MEAEGLKENSDSLLVVYRILGNFETRGVMLQKYLQKINQLKQGFKEVEFIKIPRTKNGNAHALTKLASAIYSHLTKEVLVEVQTQRTIDEVVIMEIKDDPG